MRDGQTRVNLTRKTVEVTYFLIGDRRLRLIDAPGIGDTRGVGEDEKNFDHILQFISQYEHLNGICILLKPNEQRMNILFRFCIKELLTHLHVSAKDNIIFVFTNARSTFYLPGATAPLLKHLLNELRENTNVDVPFDRSKTLLDSTMNPFDFWPHSSMAYNSAPNK